MKIGYGRVSTSDQSPDLQTDALKAKGCERVFIEKASGAQRDRPQLEAALSHLRKGDVLIVWKLDRLARSLRQLVETVEDLEARGVGFASLTESIDTTSPGGKLTFHIFAAMAQFERELIRERVNAGLAAAKARGRVGGRPRSVSDDDIIAAKSMLTDGTLNVAQVAERIGCSTATLYRHVPAARSTVTNGKPA